MDEIEAGRHAAYELLHTASLVLFDVTKSDVRESAGGDETLVDIEIQMRDEEDDEEPDEDALRCSAVEWGAFGFIFALAVLSFADARPRGYSEKEFQQSDEFTVADLLSHLRYERGELRFYADYVKGRCMKTDITMRPSGHVTLRTHCRGEAALRWVDTLKGKRRLAAV